MTKIRALNRTANAEKAADTAIDDFNPERLISGALGWDLQHPKKVDPRATRSEDHDSRVDRLWGDRLISGSMGWTLRYPEDTNTGKPCKRKGMTLIA